MLFPREPWLISLTHDLPSSFALAGYPVHLANSQSARFSLDPKGRPHMKRRL
jgi:lysozyme family protein